MPANHAMLPKVNLLFSPENINQVDPKMLAPGCNLVASAREVGIAVTETEVAYLSSWPIGLLEAMRATLFSAVTREPRLPVMFAWAPGYDYELDLWEATATRETTGGMTVFLRSPYGKA